VRTLRLILLIAATVALAFTGNHLFGLPGAIAGAAIGTVTILFTK
jgi:hypothetical protein